MITEFKIFEEKDYRWLNSINKFWKVYLNDDLVGLRLYEIGMNKKEIEEWEEITERLYNDNNKYEHIYIGFSNNHDWSYTTENKKYLYIEREVEFMGNIELTEDDIENYRLKKDTDKYNL